MKKWLIYVFSTGVCLWGCTLNEEWTEFTSPKDEVQDMKIELPKSSDDFGQAVADEIEVTVKKLVEMNVDYSDANGSKEFHEGFTMISAKPIPIWPRNVYGEKPHCRQYLLNNLQKDMLR